MGIAKDCFRAACVALVGSGSLLLLTACGGGGGGSESSTSGDVTSSTAIPSATGEYYPVTDEGINAGGTGQVTIAWTSSNVSTDGTCSIGIQGYRVNVGLSPGYYEHTDMVYDSELSCSVVDSDNCGNVRRCTYTVETLTQASWYIALQTVDVFGNESRLSEEVVATVYE